MVIISYIVVFCVVFAINLVPAFMPPTWMVLAFFYIQYKLSLIPIVVIGALSATAGRIVLAHVARTFFRRLLSENSKENLEGLRLFVDKKRHISIPLMISYAFLPIPSNQVYITAGLAKVDIRIMALSFFIGRLISYTFWVGATHIVTHRLDDIFSKHLSKTNAVIAELIGLALIYLVMRINWNKVLRIKPSKKRKTT
jgi:membrane protein DedA with SNARE-associated domain